MLGDVDTLCKPSRETKRVSSFTATGPILWQNRHRHLVGSACTTTIPMLTPTCSSLAGRRPCTCRLAQEQMGGWGKEGTGLLGNDPRGRRLLWSTSQ